MAYHAIKAGEGDVFLSGGVECVSQYLNWAGAGGADDEARNPLFGEPMARTVETATSNATWTDPRANGLLPDVYIAMGQTAENVATSLGITRERQDEWGVTSQNRAEKAIANGFFEREITPVTMPDGRVVSTDDGPRAGRHHRGRQRPQPGVPARRHGHRRQLLPAQRRRRRGGRHERHQGRRARPHPARPGRRHRASPASPPRSWASARSRRRRQALARAGMTIGDIDLYEINEAFAAQVLPSADALGMDFDKLNVNGGAIALGHPFGSTGARITTTLLNGMQERDAQFGLETMCVGGGQGMAIIYERLS